MLEVRAKMSNGNESVFNCDDDYFIDFIHKWMHEILYLSVRWVSEDDCIYKLFQREKNT